MVPPAGAQECNSVTRGNWVSIYPKAFPHGQSTITNLAVDPLNTSTFFITNGTSVMRTTRFDCAWKEVYTLPEAGGPLAADPTAADSTIRSIQIAEKHRLRVLLAVEQRVGDVVRPRIIKSEDGGNTWVVSDVGLPPSGAIESLVLAPSDPLIGYVGIDVNGGALDLLYATTDGGTTWQLRSNIADAKPQANVHGFEVDPADASSVWAYGAGATQPGTKSQISGLLHSTDGGATFQNVEEFAQDPVGPLDVYNRGAGARIMAFRRARGDASMSPNGGETWAAIQTPPSVDSVAHGGSALDVAVTSGGRMYGFHSLTYTWQDLGAPTSGLQNVTVDRRVFRFVAHTARSVEVFLGNLDDRIPLDDNIFDVPLISTPDTPERHPPRLTPDSKTVRLDPGDSKTLRYRLDIARRPLPLNVFFLLDTSDSMGATIEDLARGTALIINELGEEFIDLKVGIGAFRAYPDRLVPDTRCDEDNVATSPRCERNYVYIRIHDITSPNAAMQTSLEALESDAGGFYKSHMGALYQLATGEGQDVHPPGPSEHDVPQGLQANFDDKALKIVIHATDEAFGRPVRREASGSGLSNPEPPEIPSNEMVANAFNARDIMQVGLSIGRSPRNDLREVAADTGALAPAEGVDCNDDGVEDLASGTPLVCDVTRTSLEADATNLVPAIINLLEAVPATSEVTLEIDGNDNVLREVAPEVHPDVVLQTANRLFYDVTFRCPLDGAGKEFDFRLAARSDGRILDTTGAKVVCSEEPLPPPLPPLPIFGIVPPIVPPPPPPPPAQLSSSTQAQGQAQAQAGAATQEEEQPQVAMAAAYKEILEKKMAEALEYEMTAYEPRRDPVSPVLVFGAGLVMGAAAYGLTLARERIQVAVQRR